MKIYPPTKIFRHRREKLKKCSLHGLEDRQDFDFYPYPLRAIPNVNGYVVLAIDAPILTQDDADKGLLILDATWRYAEKMLAVVKAIPDLHYRSLPSNLQTAYPRRQTEDRGLASIEAIYAAYTILGRDTDGLLDHYYWKDVFLEKNGLRS